MDHQGHGLSEGDRTYVRKFDDFVTDFASFCDSIKKEHPGLPFFVLGHSMGGLITSVTAYRHPKLFDGVVLSAPFFGASTGAKPDISIPVVSNVLFWTQCKVLNNTHIKKKRWILETVSDFFPKLPIVEIDNKGLSSDPSVYYRVENDPLHVKQKMTIRLGAELIRAAEEMRQNFHKIEFPFYIFGGTSDTLCNSEYWDVFYQTAKTPKELKHKSFFNGLLHEALNEKEQEQKKVLEQAIEWLVERADKLKREEKRNKQSFFDSNICIFGLRNVTAIFFVKELD
ncbi:putative hydrolase [Reticulomyxa filosa]|uniref:Putative hydrolase n=1 Tax=Reticulomyxa filosa TaxID=46433 RepID=X6N0A9_RETFI|nr:putative hydrolase [Reticulomyxa filosa]|eukprot:ETO19328.1 putative hydrolase [Reticulomyxa filosa]